MVLLGEDPIMSDQQQYKYMTVDDIRGLDDEQRHLNMTGTSSTFNGTKDQTDNGKTIGIYIYIQLAPNRDLRVITLVTVKCTLC